MNKGNTKSFAEQGLEEVQAGAAEAEQFVDASDASGDNNSEDDFQQVGGLEPVAFYYRTSAPKKGNKSPFKIIEAGQTITGTYEKSFTGGKFDNTTFLIRTEAGELAGLPSCSSITRAFDKLVQGSKVKVTYNGMQTIKGGQWEGQDAHDYTVFGNKLKPVA